jgi:hypothetical protein
LGAYQLATNRLWGGSDVALMSHWGGFGSPSAFIILPSAFAPMWLWGGFDVPCTWRLFDRSADHLEEMQAAWEDFCKNAPGRAIVLL